MSPTNRPPTPDTPPDDDLALDMPADPELLARLMDDKTDDYDTREALRRLEAEHGPR